MYIALAIDATKLTRPTRAGKNLGFLEIFQVFKGFLKGFLGFNVGLLSHTTVG